MRTEIHDVVSADCTIVDDDVCFQCMWDRRLFHLKHFVDSAYPTPIGLRRSTT